MTQELLRNLAAKAMLVTMDCSECPWMAYAIAELGITENSDEPRVKEYLKAVGMGKGKDWCSAFVNWCMNSAGHERTIKETTKAGVSAAGARSWVKWGIQLSNPRFGAITVLSRGKPEEGLGHVAFYVRTEGDKIILLGGNQLNREVCIAPYELSRLVGYRWTVSLGALVADKTKTLIQNSKSWLPY